MNLGVLAVAAALSFPAIAMGETRYGSFLFDERLPDSLFLTGEIRQLDSFELRKALRDHDVQIVIMGSAGGNLYEGLQMGSILRDKGISTYVPPGVNCESSCANMFFGGAKRKAEGQLGVHQFYSSDGSMNAPLGVAEAAAQYTMAEVIGIMNELETPPFVYEKMLGTTEMHYFSEEEKRRLDLDPAEPKFLALQVQANSFIAANPTVVERPQPIDEAAPSEALAPQEMLPIAPIDRTAGKRFERIDFFGADLDPKGHRGISLGQCEQLCTADSNCAAWSYVHASRWCWPKSGVDNFSVGIGITSGIVDWARVDTSIFDRPFLEITAKDLPGNDLTRRGIPNTSLDECRQMCEDSDLCQAFTWVGKKNICFPKSGVSRPAPFMGAISGIKQ